MSRQHKSGLAGHTNRLATRASVLYLGIPALALVLISVISYIIFRNLAGDSARRLARQYSIEAAGNFLASSNSHFVLMQQISRSTTIARWLANEDDPTSRALAFEEIMGYAVFLPNAYLMFTANDSLQAYNFSVDLAPEEFAPWGSLLDYPPEARQWFYEARDIEPPFNLNIQRARMANIPHLWSNHRMYYRNRFVGVVTVGSPFANIFDTVFGSFNVDNRRGYIIDKNGIVRTDSAGLLPVLDEHGLPTFPEMPEKAYNRTLRDGIACHLNTMIAGLFPAGMTPCAAISLYSGIYHYASIAPIAGTNWSIVVLSNYSDVFAAEQYMPLISSALALLVFSVLIGSTLVRRSVLTPLSNLTRSAAKAALSTTSTKLFGLDRRDEIGDLARTVQFMRDSLKEAMEETQRITVAAEMQRREIAEEESRAKTRFLAHMSHEIRTPMNAVLGTAEIQLQRGSPSPQTEEAFLLIYNSANLLRVIINDVLDLSKIESGKMEIIPVTYETETLIGDIVQFNLMHFGNKKLGFVLDVSEDLPHGLTGDEIRIKQVLNNLLSNAVKYTDEGEVRLSFDVESPGPDRESDNVMLVIRVSDTGQGMTAAEIDNLFTREFTRFNTQSNRAIEGSGLGMSIAYSFITMMQGDIKVESTPGKGSTFIVRLPQKTQDDRVLGRETADSLNRLEITKKLSKKPDNFTLDPMPYGRVLVVDDVDINLYVAEGILSSYEIAVEMVGSGQEAVDRVTDGKEYDIIFMDHMMPGMNGLEATRIIRGMGYTHPIVALTANAFKDTTKMFMKNGFSGFISKPIDMEKLNVYLECFIRDKHADVAKREKKSGSHKQMLAKT